jgi:hypothetical protein
MRSVNSKVNPPVELENDGITLNSGLDLVSSNLMVDKGALRDCENFEVVDRLGYQTVAGFDRFDGSLSPDQVEFWTFPVETGDGVPSVGSVFQAATGSPNYGVTVATFTDEDEVDWVIYARFDADSVVPAGTILREIAEGLVLPFTAAATAVRYTESPIVPTGDNAEDIYADFQTWNAILRSRVDALPSQPIGAHWYRDRLYVVADELRLGFENAGGVIAGTPSVTVRIEPNMILRNQDNTFCCRVLKVTVTSPDPVTNSDWAAGTVDGVFLVEPLPFYNGLTLVFNGTPPTSGLFDVLKEVPDAFNWNSGSNEYFTSLFTARALTASDPVPDYAGLWRSKSEPTAGWEYIESGWKVNYEDGTDQFGELTRITRAIDNNFSYASDSSDTTGLNGQAVSFFNGFSVPGEVSTVRPSGLRARPGWRDTNDLTVFATTTEALETADTRFLQADLGWGIFGRSTANPDAGGDVPRFILGTLVGGYEDVSFDAAAGISWGTNTAPARFLNAGNSDAMSYLTFVNLGEILGTLPQKINITGIAVEIDYDVLHQYQQERPNAESVNFVPNAVSDKFSFQAALGKISPETGNFELLGSKETTTVTLPTTQAAYSDVDTYTPGTNLTTGQAVYEDTGRNAVVGGSTSTFGNTRLDLDDLNSGNFGIVVWGGAVDSVFLTDNTASWAQAGSDVPNAGGWIRFKINRLRIKLYYTQPAARYYITDDFGATTPNVCSADLVAYSVLSGQLENKNATGEMQFVNIQPVTGFGFKTCIYQGDTIHQLDIVADTLSAANQVATVSGATAGDVGMGLNGFPALKDIVAEGSRYQFITANFFAREDWDGFYGVSGAGKAFSFAAFDADNDGDEEQYVQFITTNTIVSDEDKPRHVEFHQYHLALGYKDGTVRFSVPGEPENFDGIAGAAEVGVGDRVTGLLAMRGKALGVFCENSIYTILGDSADTFNVETLAPKTGAIEYTVVDMGIPLYCDNRGISTLEQSQKYGNFVGIRISQKVSPWILPRMTRSDNLFSLNQGAGVVCAVPVRAKNQYRIFFRDGKVLILTMNGDGSLAFTYALYYLNEDKDEFLVPIAHSSQVDGNGQERIHMAHYSPRSAISASDSRYVYEFEKGYGFDGDWFDAFFDTAFFYKDPFRDTTVRKVRADGLTKGYGPYTITVGADYDEDSYSATDVNISLPRNPAATVSDDLKPSTTMANVAKDGRCLSFRIKRDETKKTLVPPTVYQVLLVQYQNGGKRDA